MRPISKTLLCVVAAGLLGAVAGRLARPGGESLQHVDAAGDNAPPPADGDRSGELARLAGMGFDELGAEHGAEPSGPWGDLILARMAALDPARALAEGGDPGSPVAFAAWARRDPAAAEAEVRRRLEGGHEDGAIVLAVGGEIIAADPDRALELARNAGLSGWEMHKLFARWAHADADAATAHILAEAPSLSRQRTEWRLEEVLAELATGDPQRAYRWLGDLPDGWWSELEHTLTITWSELDPRGALVALRGGEFADDRESSPSSWRMTCSTTRPIDWRRRRSNTSCSSTPTATVGYPTWEISCRGRRSSN